jgi:hypothetical protein
MIPAIISLLSSDTSLPTTLPFALPFESFSDDRFSILSFFSFGFSLRDEEDDGDGCGRSTAGGFCEEDLETREGVEETPPLVEVEARAEFFARIVTPPVPEAATAGPALAPEAGLASPGSRFYKVWLMSEVNIDKTTTAQEHCNRDCDWLPSEEFLVVPFLFLFLSLSFLSSCRAYSFLLSFVALSFQQT